MELWGKIWAAVVQIAKFQVWMQCSSASDELKQNTRGYVKGFGEILQLKDIHPFRQGEETQEELFVSEGGKDEWYSSDHGAQFLSLMNSGTLDVLLSQGKEYALLVNPDNAAAVVDLKILNHLAQNSIEYCMEVMPTTSTSLMNFMASSLQGKFKSDLHKFAEGVLVQNDARTSPINPSIDLGPEFKKISDFKSRFKTIPSIIRLESLKETGDVQFGADITLKGRVVIAAKPGVELHIPDGVMLKNEEINDPSDI